MSLIGGAVLLYLSNALSASAGLGGGSLNVPIFINVFGFSYHDATILSLCALMGNYLFQVLINLEKPHPTARSASTSRRLSLISWETVLVLSPSEWGGSNLGFADYANAVSLFITLSLNFIYSIGVIFSESVPSTLLYMIALIVLSIAFCMSIHKGYTLFHEESKHLYKKEIHFQNEVSINSSNSTYQTQQEEIQHLLAETLDQNKISPMVESQTRIIPRYLYCYMDQCNITNFPSTNNNIDSTENEYTSLDSHSTNNESSKANYENEIEVPWLIVGVIFSVWLVYALFYFLLKLYSVCSWSYVVLLLFLYPLLLCEVVWGLSHVAGNQRRDRLQRRAINIRNSAETVEQEEGIINWDAFAVLLPLLTFAIGILTSLMGIGGGELIGPLLLTLRVVPAASSATTSFMSLLNSSSSVLHYLLLGEIPIAKACGMFAIGALGGISGRAGALYVSQRFGRASVMVFALSAVLLVSFAMYFSYLLSEAMDFSFTSLCS